MTIEQFQRQLKKAFVVFKKTLTSEQTMKIEDIVLTLENGERLRQQMQDKFYDYAKNKKIRLRKRFDVWSKLCDKTSHHRRDVVLFVKLEEIGFKIPDYYYITWEDILLLATCDEERVIVQELLIKENFGTVDVRTSISKDKELRQENLPVEFTIENLEDDEDEEEEEYDGN